MEIKVFGMANCAGCETVKRILKGQGVAFVEYDVMNPDHMTEASNYNVRGVPSVVFHNENGHTMITGSSQKDIAEIKQLLEV